MLTDEPNAEERLEKLPEDHGTPFQPADPSRDDSSQFDEAQQAAAEHLDDTHPDTDSSIDLQELYDEGVSGAAGVSEPNAGNAVVNYNKPDDTGTLS